MFEATGTLSSLVNGLILFVSLIALGNIVGSAFINMTCILGMALVVSPLRVNMAAFSDLALFSLITNMILWYFLSSERISWREGAVLLFTYFLFPAISFGRHKAQKKKKPTHEIRKADKNRFADTQNHADAA